MSDPNETTDEERPLNIEAPPPDEVVPADYDQDKAEVMADEVVANESEAAAEASRKRRELHLPKATAEGMPPWCIVPDGFQFPRGKQVLFLRFKSSWTDAPWKGEPMMDPATGKAMVEDPSDPNAEPILWRQCIVWPINTADKKLALGRAQRDPNKAGDEMCKQMIRCADGIQSDWAVVRQTGVEMFWNELGERCRGLMTRMFTQLHVLDTDATSDFLQNCIEVRSTGT